MGVSTSRVLLVVLAVALISYPCSGAVVHGVVYSWENLKPLPKAVIVVNTTPEQKYVTPDGHYSFTLPPGCYVIRAYYYQDGRVVLYAEDNITIEGNGSYIVDLILFPPLNFNFSQPNVEFPTPVQNGNQNALPLWSFAVILALIVVVYALRKVVKGRERSDTVRSATGAGLHGTFSETPSESEFDLGKNVKAEKTEIEKTGRTEIERLERSGETGEKGRDVGSGIMAALPDDLRETLEIIVSSGGRITQKELRNRLKYSEAKVSLILTDLERRGYIEKVRKGRGNVVFLKDEYRKFFGLD